MPIDMSNAVSAPKKRTTAKTPAKSAPTVVETRSPNERRTEGLLGLAQLGQGLCMIFGQHADAMTIGTHFPPVAKELANVADSNDVIAKPIDFMIEIGPYGALIAAVMPMALQLAANHGLIDASRLAGQGIVPPAVLEAQAQTEMMRMQAEYVRQQQEAMAEAEAVRREFEAAMKEAA